MLQFVMLLSVAKWSLAASIAEAMPPQLDGRIVGGEATTIGSFPWQVSILKYGYHACGGAIYSSKIIVTAAHCLEYVSAAALKVRAGSTYRDNGGVLVNVKFFKRHEKYNRYNVVNDIAIIKLVSAVTFSLRIKAIGLAISTPAHGAAAVVSGWGSTSFVGPFLPTQLRSVEVKIVSRDACASATYGYGYAIHPTMICSYTVGKDACQGDSGGPLVSGGVLVGVVSWGHGCAWPNYPGVYADVASLRSWLLKAIDSV